MWPIWLGQQTAWCNRGVFVLHLAWPWDVSTSMSLTRLTNRGVAVGLSIA